MLSCETQQKKKQSQTSLCLVINLIRNLPASPSNKPSITEPLLFVFHNPSLPLSLFYTLFVSLAVLFCVRLYLNTIRLCLLFVTRCPLSLSLDSLHLHFSRFSSSLTSISLPRITLPVFITSHLLLHSLSLSPPTISLLRSFNSTHTFVLSEW